ncbi:AAA family ATPase [Neptuniibacter sp. QD29_5]|uniref:AAA family ATPase n=1 Tax=Neptuniibacter sp. QD29_5 TaxID=3398207 RepID=UPI0039F5E489
MPKEQRLITESHIRSSESIPSYTEPYRHTSYKRALSGLREALQSENSVILKGVEGTGKSTLINELISEFQHIGVPVAIVNKPLTEPSQLYSQLTGALKATTQKEDLLRTLQSLKETDQFCLCIIDQQAINSDDSVINSLQQLCEIDETTKGAIKLVVVRQDYIVINSDGLKQADFINWINTEIVLDLFQLDDIEGYIHYLSSKEGLPATPYEIGTDLLMIEQSEGRINRLNELLLPLIDNKIITREDLNSSKENPSHLTAAKIGIYSLSITILLILGFGINHFLNSGSESIEPHITDNTPIFAEPKPLQKSQVVIVKPPSITVTEKEMTTNGLNDSEYKTDTLTSPAHEAEQQMPTQEISITGQPINTMPLSNIEQKNKYSLEERTTFLTDQMDKQSDISTVTVIDKSRQISGNTTISNTPLRGLSVPAQEKAPPYEKTSSEVAQLVHKPASINNNEVAQLIEDPVNKEKHFLRETPVQENDITSPITLATAQIDHWVAAWQAKDQKSYFRSYKPNFTGIYETHQRWLQKRRDAINRPQWIKLIREELHNIVISENQIKVDFWLQYEAASGYKDKTLKQLTLIKVNGEWLIAKEHNIKVETN